MTYDVIIVGAGSAGCVLAARLSEDPGRSVLLLEAGPDYPTLDTLPPEIRTGFNPVFTHDWGYRSEPDATPAIAFTRGKLVGGCSATNGSYCVRGNVSDYDEWAAMGNPDWSFEQLLPFFKRVETDADFHTPWHGTDGPIPVRRYRDDEMHVEQAAFLQAARAIGHADMPDYNAPGAVGAGKLPTNTREGIRWSAALGYLAPARQRANLAIRGNCLVDRVTIDSGRATGVRLAGTGEVLASRHVILAAGAYASPALLMRSGIGPADHLRSLGIDVVRDAPGVGRNLADHPLLRARFTARLPAPYPRTPGCQAMLALKSTPGRAGHDLQVFPGNINAAPPDQSPTGYLLTLHVSLMKPASTGTVRLRSRDPDAAPVIDHAYLTHPDDMPRLLVAMRTAQQIARTEPFASLVVEPVSASADAGASDEALATALRATVGTYYHPVGTCRMGPSSDSGAVVDSRGAVHGVGNLSVIDASIMPTLPAANTNVPTMMAAERCAAGWRG